MARCFNKGYGSRFFTPLKSSFKTPRDIDGHKSHTLSTAGGKTVQRVSVFGQGNGTSKAGSPKMRVVSYKVCCPPVIDGGCFNADILLSFDIAIHDGVDVLFVSLIEAASNFLYDSVANGAFYAAMKGIVVFSARNTGLYDATVGNQAQWYVTVAASTIER